jgi:predicted ATP-grasp superfamily ATP-dependent carboligase
MSVLVTCGDTRAGLTAIRALGRAGIAVVVGAAHRPALGFWSRYATTTLLLPDAEQDARRFAAAVADEVACRGLRAVLPATDAAIWALSRWRDALPRSAQALMPPHDAVVVALDRSALHDRARGLGLACMPTERIGHADDVEPALRRLSASGADRPFAALVRPVVSWVEREDGSRRTTAAIPVASIGALRRLLYERDDLIHGGCVVEPRPSGRVFGYGVVCQHGDVVAEVFQERLREQDGLSGVSTWACTLPVDEDIRALARPLLHALGFHGAGLLELFRGDDGVLRLVNLVPRLWGSLGLAVQAGVNVPLLLLRSASDAAVQGGVVAAADESWRWAIGDLAAIAGQARRLTARLQGRDVVATRLSALRALLGVHAARRARADVLAPDDPMPAVLELQQRLGR